MTSKCGKPKTERPLLYPTARVEIQATKAKNKPQETPKKRSPTEKSSKLGNVHLPTIKQNKIDS